MSREVKLRVNWMLLWNLGAPSRAYAMGITFISLITVRLLHDTALSFGFSWLIGAALYASLVVLSRAYIRLRG